MHIVLTETDFIKLKRSTRADLLKTLFPLNDDEPTGDDTLSFNWDEVASLTPGEVEEFMSGCSEETIAGLRIVAENGPQIHASLLEKAGIENYGHFQGRVTKRTRTVTGNKHAYLFAWDDWNSEENEGVGHYAVTAATHRSLRIFFDLE